VALFSISVFIPQGSAFVPQGSISGLVQLSLNARYIFAKLSLILSSAWIWDFLVLIT